MGLRRDAAESRRTSFGGVSVPATITLLLVLALVAGGASAQDVQPAASPSAAHTYQTLYLTNAVDQNQATEITGVLRNMLPKARINYVRTENAIAMEGTDEDFATARKVLADLDRPERTWRITYTMTQMNGDTPVGAPQHVAVIVAAGDRTYVKQGKRIPIVTGTTGNDATPGTQVQYIDVGMNIDASAYGSADGLRLETKIVQSGVVDEPSSMGAKDPAIRQTTLQGTSNLTPGKPLVLGSLEAPGSTAQEKIEVEAEVVR